MRNLLMLALLLYNIVALATRSNKNYDYDYIDNNKKLIDERRNWRKKALLKTEHHKDWDNKRHEFDNPRVGDFSEMGRPKEQDMSAAYRTPQRFDDLKLNIPSGMRSSELSQSSPFLEKDVGKKSSVVMNCERPHERQLGTTPPPCWYTSYTRYEACFAGCASVSCDNPRDRLRPCYPFCEPGCICIHPYVRDERTHKCTLPEDCTKGLKGIPDLGEDI